MHPSSERILEHYTPERAAEYAARGWYTLARLEARRLARKHGTTLRVAAGVIAAVSPMNVWSGNILAAERILAAAARGDRRAPRAGLSANVAKAWRIARAGERPLDVLSGPKVRAFYRNILGDLSAVTVDRWAARAAGVPDSYPGTAAGYARCEEAYREAALKVGLAPAILQAVVWCNIRGKVT